MHDRTTPADDRFGLSTLLALTAMGLSVIVINIDFSSVNVALPDIERELSTDVSTAQWVVNAYALVFAMAIVPAGRLADLIGRKRIFLVGSMIFAGMSLLGSFAWNIDVLIGARALMGIGAAMMWPAMLGMTFAAVPPSRAGIAGGVIIGAAGIGMCIGPLLGGVLTEFIGWQATLWINVPVTAGSMLVTWLVIHQPTPGSKERRIDFAGIVVFALALLAMLFALDQAPAWGWTDSRIIGCLLFSAACFVVFPFIERFMGPAALIPAAIVRNRIFLWPVISIALVSGAFFGMLLYVPQFFEETLGRDPLQAGMALLPAMIPFTLVSFVSGPLYRRLGARVLIVSGAAGLAIGPLLLSYAVLSAHDPWPLVPGLALMGFGVGAAFPALTTRAVTSLHPDQASLGGGIVYMIQVAGGGIGLGAATSAFALVSRLHLESGLAAMGGAVDAARTTSLEAVLQGTRRIADVTHGLPPETAAKLTTLVSESATTGIAWALRVDAALAAIGLLVALLFVHGSTASESDASD